MTLWHGRLRIILSVCVGARDTTMKAIFRRWHLSWTLKGSKDRALRMMNTFQVQGEIIKAWVWEGWEPSIQCLASWRGIRWFKEMFSLSEAPPKRSIPNAVRLEHGDRGGEVVGLLWEASRAPEDLSLYLKEPEKPWSHGMFSEVEGYEQISLWTIPLAAK